MNYDDYSDERIRALEQRLYDEEAEGHDTWFERDQILWEMNRRGLFDERTH